MRAYRGTHKREEDTTPRVSSYYSCIYHSFYDAFGSECKVDEWKDTSRNCVPEINREYNAWPGYVPDKILRNYGDDI